MAIDTDRIDRLMHDAEHADAGVEFAQYMMGLQPDNPEHREVRERLAEKARVLRERATLLQKGIEPTGPDPD